jgi:tRNA(Ile)-lysidine synthase
MKRLSDSIERNVAEFIRLHGLFAGAGRILLAVSGGADSTALLHIAQSLHVKRVISAELVCAHVNHHLRGPASDGDERFVIEQATRLRLPVVTRAVDVRTEAKTHRLSVETAARRLRLAALGEIAKTHGCTWVATGHQKNDNAETVVQRLRRGTGFRGLAGIWPVRWLGDGPWFASPLLDVAREEIITYLSRHNVGWREDRTNIDPAYTRNYIRHKLLPALQQESSGSLIEELSELAASARRLYDRIQRDAKQAALDLAQSLQDEVVIEAPGLTLLPGPVAVELVRQALVTLGCGEQNLTEGHYRGIMQLARGPAGAKTLSLPGGFAARRDHEKVILTPRKQSACKARLSPPRPSTEEGRSHDMGPMILQIPGETHFAGCRIQARVVDRRNLKTGEIKGQESPFREYFDFDCVRQPVLVRFRRAGDRFRPLGQASEKNLGKFLTAAKVSRQARGHVLVFADGEKIIWACPVRMGEGAKITEETQRILVLEAIPGEAAESILADCK